MKTNKTLKQGFTLIELMIVVAIIGILAAVAIPAFINYMTTAKTSEAPLNLRSINVGATAYYDAKGNYMPPTIAQTPSADPGPTPLELTDLIEGEFDKWDVLKWRPHKAVLYRYTWDNEDCQTFDACKTITNGTAAAASYAQGDLDGDDTLSTFGMAVQIFSGHAKLGELEVTEELE